MRIVCISASNVPSSTANSIQVMKTCQALAQLGHQIHLVVPAYEQKSDTSVELSSYYGLQTSFPIEWLPVRPRMKRYDFALAAVKRAYALQAELVYTWPPQAALAALLRGLPIALELHDMPEGHFGPLLFKMILALPGKKRLLPITQALADALQRAYHAFTPSKVVIAPDGVDLERYQNLPEPAQARQALGLPEAFTGGYTGHLYPGRGLGLLVTLARRFPQVRFLWVGGRPETVTQWQNELSAQGIGNITLAGFVENSRLALFQAAAEVLLMPYERVITGSSGGNTADYCSPMKMFEYMACHRAILSSDLPVIGEVLNERNAVLCAPEDEEAWVKALDSLLRDETRRNALAQQAWQDVQPYTWIERERRALAGFPNP
jgi:glycosyltransferase involved in cell wall biosynthesis